MDDDQPPAHRALLSVKDAARVVTAAATSAEALSGIVEVAGPEVLSWRDVADTQTHILHRPVRVVSRPALPRELPTVA